jgi:hypothetical protein
MPAVWSLLVTLIVLFGGYFAHQWFNVEKPMEKAIQSTPHVTLEELRINPGRIEIRLSTDENFSLAADYIPLQEKLRSLSGGRPLNIELVDRADAVLEKTWSRMAFGVTEAVFQRRYTQIPETVEKEAEAAKVRHEVAMDDRFIYVALYHEDHSLYRVLPLETGRGGEGA